MNGYKKDQLQALIELHKMASTTPASLRSKKDIKEKKSNYVIDMINRAETGQDWEYKPTMKIMFTNSQTHWFDINKQQLEKIKKIFR